MLNNSKHTSLRRLGMIIVTPIIVLRILERMENVAANMKYLIRESKTMAKKAVSWSHNRGRYNSVNPLSYIIGKFFTSYSFPAILVFFFFDNRVVHYLTGGSLTANLAVLNLFSMF